jgi:hypothetical protein
MNLSYNKKMARFDISGTKAELDSLKPYLQTTNGVTYLNIHVALSEQKDYRALLEEKMQEIEAWVVNTYRPLFKGKKKGSLGDRYGCVQKMAMFLIANPEYTKEDILTITKEYISSFGEIYTYLKQADHFIFKEELHQGKKVLTSKLLALLEDGPGSEPKITDWFDTVN